MFISDHYLQQTAVAMIKSHLLSSVDSSNNGYIRLLSSVDNSDNGYIRLLSSVDSNDNDYILLSSVDSSSDNAYIKLLSSVDSNDNKKSTRFWKQKKNADATLWSKNHKLDLISNG